MSLVGDSVVYVIVLFAVLAVVAGIMYAVARMRKPPQDDSQVRATRAYEEALGRS